MSTRPAGSAGPRIDACNRFAVRTGRSAAIGTLTDAPAFLAGTAIALPRPAAPFAVPMASTKALTGS